MRERAASAAFTDTTDEIARASSSGTELDCRSPIAGLLPLGPALVGLAGRDNRCEE